MERSMNSIVSKYRAILGFDGIRRAAAQHALHYVQRNGLYYAGDGVGVKQGRTLCDE